MFRKFYLEVKDNLEKVLEEKNWQTKALKIEEPREIADLATATPFEISSKTNKTPIDVATEIAKEIEKKETTYIEKVEPTQPGYVNFYLDKTKLKQHINQLIKGEIEIGSIEEHKGSIVIEHTSANPTGPLHIGHLRNALIGDALANILEKSGYNTTTQYYLNDMGKQMAMLLFGVEKHGINQQKHPDEAIGEIYTKINSEIKKEDEEKIKKMMQKLENEDQELKEKLDAVVDQCFKGIEDSLKTLDIEVDEVIKESKFVFDGSVNKAYDKLREHIKIKDGAAQIEFEDIDKELVLKRADGTSVYALRDLAYHTWKAKKGNNIDILGSDHKLYSKQLTKTLKLLDVKPPEVIIFEFVSLPSGEMSTRKGEFVSIRELFEKVKEAAYQEVDERREGKKEWKQEIAKEVAKAAIRYDFIKVAPNKPISFDYEKAVSFKEQGAPFIQYSHARASNIKKKSKQNKPKLNQLNHQTTIELLKQIAKFSYAIEKSAQKRKPHLFAEYLFNLASKFNQFYRDIPVLDSEGKKKQNRLAIVEATQKALKEGTQTLGFKAPKEM